MKFACEIVADWLMQRSIHVTASSPRGRRFQAPTFVSVTSTYRERSNISLGLDVIVNINERTSTANIYIPLAAMYGLTASHSPSAQCLQVPPINGLKSCSIISFTFSRHRGASAGKISCSRRLRFSLSGSRSQQNPLQRLPDRCSAASEQESPAVTVT